jgi:hypothetical protein
MAQPYILANDAYLQVQTGSTKYTIAGSTGLLYSEEKPIFMPDSTVFDPYFVETLTLTSVGLSVSTTPAYGLTVITPNTTGGDFSTSPRKITIALPITGVRKSIVFNSTGTVVNTLSIDFTTNAGVQSGSASTDRFIQFSSLATLPQAVNMIGVSTSVWQVLSIESTIPGFGNSTGIRNVNAQETT